MSRTCARQQRMRQQTLNEERMSHAEEAVRSTGERRSSGSKLIISSPTPIAYPFMNHTTPVSQSTPLSDLNSSRNLTQPHRGVGASALLAFLSGSDHRASTHATNTNASQPPPLPQQQQPQSEPNTQSKPNSSQLAPILISSRSGQSDGSAVTVASTATSLGSVSSANPIPYSTATSTSCTNKEVEQPSDQCDPSSLLLNSVGQPQSDTVAVPTGSSDSGSQNAGNMLPVDISTMELESTVSPASSNLNSPMESCFPNIVEDQESDSFDLNNITPSIHLFSSPQVGTPGEFLTGYGRPHTGALDGTDRTTPRVPSAHEQARLGLRIAHVPELTNPHTPNHNQPPQAPHRSQHSTAHLMRRGMIAKTEEDDLALSKASTSCPAEMQDSLPGFGTSPIQLNTLACHNAQPGSGGGGSGGSLGGNSTNDGIPTGAGGPGSVLYASPSSLARSCDDPRAAWVRDRDRTKKDSHNRIERKRRDYINCQISELGNLLPEDMFRDGDCKKNKGSILKNSVEFIYLLRSELAQVPEVRKETMLAAKVIGELTKRIQELESLSGSPPSNLDYQRTLQEWFVLHERNSQNRTTLSPSAKSSFLYRTDATGGSSSPGLSSLGTEDLMTTDTKSVFSSPGLLAGSAPAPSAPLTSCSRLHSPVSGGSTNPRVSGALDSPLRMMRTRCTSLTVAGTSPLDPTGIRMPTAELSHTQQHQLLQSQQGQQRILSGQALRGVPTTATALSLGTGNNNNSSSSTANQSGQLRGSSLLHMHNRPWPQPPTDGSAASRLPSQLSPQHQQPQVLAVQHRHSHVARPMDLLQVSDEQDMCCSGLSASLPVHVNPLLCGLPDREDGKLSDKRLPHVYSFERDEFLTQLKTEPLSEADSSRASELGYPDAGRSSTDLAFADSGSGALGMRTRNSVETGNTTTSHATNANYVTDMALDPPLQHAFEAEEFQFDDVPME